MRVKAGHAGKGQVSCGQQQQWWQVSGKALFEGGMVWLCTGRTMRCIGPGMRQEILNDFCSEVAPRCKQIQQKHGAQYITAG